MEKENFSELPDFIKRDLEFRGMSVSRFFEIQEEWHVFFTKIRKAFVTGVLED